MKRAVLAIGDIKPSIGPKRLSFLDRSFFNFLDYKDLLSRRSVEQKVCDYSALLKGGLPRIDSHRVKVMLFFPYRYWNKHIERKSQDGRIYGDRTYGEKFKRFFDVVDSKLKRAYKDQNLSFVNPPMSIKIDRDKKRAKLLFKKYGLPTPITYKVKCAEDIIDLVNEGRTLFLKPRFGAMGKGVTYLTRDRWYTNFLLQRRKLISRGTDYGWDFVDITGKTRILEELIKEDFILEEAIDLPTIDGRKFDLRCYVIYGEIPYLYARSIPATSIVTNWSQGGRIEGKSFLARIPKKQLMVAKMYALKAAKALGLNYTGIDLLFSRDYSQVYVLEAHSFPSYETRFDLVRSLMGQL